MYMQNLSSFESLSRERPCLVTLATELIVEIFANIHPALALRYRRLSRRVNRCLSDPHFAMLNLARHFPVHDMLKSGSTVPDALDRAWLCLPEPYQTIYAKSAFAPYVSLIWSAKVHIGMIPAAIQHLTKLNYLCLDGNKLTGAIPREIGQLVNLIYLDLHGNALNSEIPAEIGNLVQLQRLYLAGNQLYGPIPDSIGNLSNCQCISLNRNRLSNLPSSIGKLTNLRSLHLSDNEITGEIPNSIGNLEHLQYLNLAQNQLCGDIPASIGRLRNLNLLNLNFNKLGGCVPREMSCLENLHQLNVRENEFLNLELDFDASTGNGRVWELLTQQGFHSKHL